MKLYPSKKIPHVDTPMHTLKTHMAHQKVDCTHPVQVLLNSQKSKELNAHCIPQVLAQNSPLKVTGLVIESNFVWWILIMVENVFVPKLLQKNDSRPKSNFHTYVHCKLKVYKLVLDKDSDQGSKRR